MNRFEIAREFYLLVREFKTLTDRYPDGLSFMSNEDSLKAGKLSMAIDKELKAFTDYDVNQLPFDKKEVIIAGRHIQIDAIRAVLENQVIVISAQDARELREKAEPLLSKIKDEIALINDILDRPEQNDKKRSREAKIKREQDKLRARR
jgi:DICT domain-containing protein